MRKKLTLAFFPSPSSSSPKKPLDESVPPFRCRNPIKRGEDDLASFLRRRNRRFFGVFQVPTIFLLLAFLPKSSLFSGHSSSTGDDGHIRTVSTPFGVLLGQTVRFSSSNAGTSAGGKQLAPVTQFLGVPYGMAPTGQSRFNMAVSAAKWMHHPKDAFRMPAACMQSAQIDLLESEALKRTSAQRFDRMHRMHPFLRPQSEDCLFMNLFVPEPNLGEEGAAPQNALPVLVLVHGGAYGWGGAAAHNASLLAAFGRIMVVTLNYRLGIFGWLGKCEPNSCSGNGGLSDLVAALKMLSNILPSFGADPAAVTLLGWESGASLVSLLMASPITQPMSRLFRRAILLDGTALSPWALTEGPQEYLMQVATNLSCYNPLDHHLQNTGGGSSKRGQHSHHNTFQWDVGRILRCLQEHGPQNVSSAAKRVLAPTFLTAFGPIVDGQIVPNHPKISFSPRFGALFRDIDLLVGTISHPAYHLLPSADVEHGMSLERRNKLLRTLVRNLFDYHRQEIFHAILNEYTDWRNPRDEHPRTLRNSVMDVLNDVLFTTPLVETARMHATDEFQKTSNTFFFHFSHETPGWTRERPGDGIRGSLSDDHIPYILGYPVAMEHVRDPESGFNVYGSGYTADDRAISRVMMNYVANFVRSGDPTKPRPRSAESSIEDRFYGTPWPQYSQATREAYMEIGADRPDVKYFYRNSYVSFWDVLIPVMNKPSTNVPEEHNFLTDYFNRQSFYGTVRPYSSFHNIPFPPPPMPPTPFPKDATKRLGSVKTSAAAANLSTIAGGQQQDSTDQQVQQTTSLAKSDGYFNSFWTVVVTGVFFLVLHLCIYAACFNKCLANRKEMKVLSYHGGYTAHSPLDPMDVNVNYIPPNAASGNFGAPMHQRVLSTSRSINLAMSAAAAEAAGTYHQRTTRTIGPHEKRTSFIESCDDDGDGTTSYNGSTPWRNNSASSSTAAAAISVYRTTTKKPSLGAIYGRTAAASASGLPAGGGARASTANTLLRQNQQEDNNNNNDGKQQQRNNSTAAAEATISRNPLSATTSSVSSSTTLTRTSIHRTPYVPQQAQASAGKEQQDPLLLPPNMRISAGISPTCPRHGRAAQLLAANRQQMMTASPNSTVLNAMGNSAGQQQQSIDVTYPNTVFGGSNIILPLLAGNSSLQQQQTFQQNQNNNNHSPQQQHQPQRQQSSVEEIQV